MHRLKLLAVLLAVASAGCASTTKMPLQVSDAAPDLSGKSLLVARVKIRNDNRPTQQPVLLSVATTQHAAGKRTDATWTGATLLSDKEKDGKEYFASFTGVAGTLRIESMVFYRRMALAEAFALAQLQSQVEVPAGKVVYLGALEAVIVKKANSTEPSAGNGVPIIPQAVAGFSTGKWQLAVADDYDAAVAELREKYPFLKDVEIVKEVLQLPAGTPGVQPSAESPQESPKSAAEPARQPQS